MEKLCYTVKEAASVIGVSVPTMYEIARREDFPSIRVSEKRIVIPCRALEDWLEREAAKRCG